MHRKRARHSLTCRALFKKRSSSEGDLSAEFQHAGVEVAGYRAEVSVGGGRVYGIEVGVIEGIEGLESKFKLSSFTRGKRNDLEQREVPVLEARTSDRILPG